MKHIESEQLWERIFIVVVACFLFMVVVMGIMAFTHKTEPVEEKYEPTKVIRAVEPMTGEKEILPLPEIITEAETERETGTELCESTTYVPAIIPDEPPMIITPISDAEMIAKVLYRECPYCSKEQQSAVVWVILNRVDNGYGTISEVVTAPNQFDYSAYSPVREDLLEIAKDVLARWEREKDGEEDVGRTIPADYLWFTGDGKVNWFRNDFRGANGYWDWSLPSPYGGE